jgi:putative heme iron utilization protein
MSAGAAARAYLRRHHGGVLSTISARLSGYPFGSVVPYVLDHEARPVILISRLAEHTRNIAADARTSLLVNDSTQDLQASSRLTLIGDTTRVDHDPALFQARYLRYFPDSSQLFALGDFALHRIEPRQLRWIGGFGDIQWISAEAYRPPANRLAEQEAGILAHMNADHSHNLLDYCRFVHGTTPGEAQMIGIDCDGFDLRCDGNLLRFDFDITVTDAVTAREMLVVLAQKARAK